MDVFSCALCIIFGCVCARSLTRSPWHMLLLITTIHHCPFLRELTTTDSNMDCIVLCMRTYLWIFILSLFFVFGSHFSSSSSILYWVIMTSNLFLHFFFSSISYHRTSWDLCALLYFSMFLCFSLFVYDLEMYARVCMCLMYEPHIDRNSTEI